MYKKQEPRPNPKKQKSARRKRRNYWGTEGRIIFKAIVCPDCIKLIKKDFSFRKDEAEKNKLPLPKERDYSLKCGMCKLSKKITKK